MPARSALSILGGRIGRHTAAYLAGSVLTFGLGFVNVAVLTRLLPTEQYGRLAVLLFFAVFLTVLFNLGSLQGGISLAFGAVDDELGGEEEGRVQAQEGPRRVLTTTLAFTIAVAGLGTAITVVLAPLLSELVVGGPAEGRLVVLSALCGGTGAVWRLVSLVPRYERRPRMFVALAAMRPILVVGFSVVLVLGFGRGLQGALEAIAIGTLVSTPIALVATRSSYALKPRLSDIPAIIRRGRGLIPVVLSFFVIRQADVFLLAQFVSSAQVGLYRVASRAGSSMSYLVSAFNMSWSPIARESIYAAAKRERGPETAGAVLATYFAMASLGTAVGLAVTADLLIRIAPRDYWSAAPLIPLVGLTFLVHGWFIVVYRIARFPRKRIAYIGLVVLAGLAFVGLSLLLIPPLGAYGVIASAIAAEGAALLVMFGLSQRGPNPVPYPYGRIFGAAGLAGLCVVLDYGSRGLLGTLRPVGSALALGLYPVLLVALGVLPWAGVRSLLHLLPRRGRRRTRADLEARLRRLAPRERDLLKALICERRSLTEIARSTSTREDAIQSVAVQALRELAGSDARPDCDSDLGKYLLLPGSRGERDQTARRLWAQGVDPLDMHALESTIVRVRRLSRRAWRRVLDEGEGAK